MTDLHELDAGVEGVVPAEEQQEGLLGGQDLGHLDPERHAGEKVTRSN